MSKSIPKELQEVYDRVWSYFFHEIPVSEMTLEQVFADEVMGYGTTKDEVIKSFNELHQLLQAQAIQGKGLEFDYKRSTVHQHLSEDRRTGIFAEEFSLSIRSGDDIQKIEARSSLVFELINNDWKLVHLHSSIPSDSENDSWHLDEWKREKEKLEKLVAEKTTDLQQKNRELELEAATERVRTAAMGMQQPDDIMKVLEVVKNEVGKFELDNIGTWFWIFNDDHTLTQWDISEVDPLGPIEGINITIDLKKAKSFRKHDKKMHGKEYYNMLWEGDELQEVVDDVKDVDPVSGQKFQEAVDSGFLDPYWQACAPFSRGVLGLDYIFEPPKAVQPILTKMASAFDMAYQRFEDLQKAEQRRKEAELEAAVERVRSRAMGMQSSDDFSTVLISINKELQELELEGQNSAYIWIRDDENRVNIWNLEHFHEGSDQDIHKGAINFNDCRIFKRHIQDWEAKPDLFITHATKEQLYDFADDFRKAYPEKDEMEIFQKLLDEGNIGEIWATCAGFGPGFIGADFLQQPDEWIEKVLRKMADAFGMAYQRYEDLQQAEQRRKEAELEASVERVRAHAMGMQKPDNIVKVLQVMKAEIARFELGNISTWMWTLRNDDKVVHWELADHFIEGGLEALSIVIDPSKHDLMKPYIDQIDNGYFSFHYADDDVLYYLKGASEAMPSIADTEAVRPFREAVESGKIKNIWQVCSTFNGGLIGLMFVTKPPEHTRHILVKITDAFGVAYQRFKDLQEAEKQTLMIREERDRLEIALEKLHATQDQLVQQEKLASLGQLTAGIAHEIKNPLNFVNNFSEVSLELIEEAREEVRQGDGRRAGTTPLSGGAGGGSEKAKDSDLSHSSEADTSFANPPLNPLQGGEAGTSPDSALILEILDDIEANLRKIHEHGSRADGIVKSMLQHSRGGDGTMEPTPLNPLIKEYVNLAFHGMRAGKEPINVDIKLELDENIGDVPLIAEDFSRVILNLCNNGFDAMREKQGSGHKAPRLSPGPEKHRQGAGDYKPKLMVRTKSENGQILIEVQDNGPGIPDEIKDKILQPFFTTKKGTQGTGLGLSITNDIVKAHGGILIAESSKNEGSIFTISIPLQINDERT